MLVLVLVVRVVSLDTLDVFVSEDSLREAFSALALLIVCNALPKATAAMPNGIQAASIKCCNAHAFFVALIAFPFSILKVIH